MRVSNVIESGNFTDGLPTRPVDAEITDIILNRPNMRIERIVSTGQTSGEDDWYDQPGDEWVMLVAGAARLRIEGEDDDRILTAGDWLLLQAHCRHRVTWTQATPPTVWLALHMQAGG